MIDKINSLIQQSYRVEPLRIGNTIHLYENSNIGTQKLAEIKLHIKLIAKFAVYKFDQTTVIGGVNCETYAPFLSEGKVRSMCDFIIFFHTKIAEEELHAWVVNLKSEQDGNNLSQMYSGQRLCEFLLGKLDDDLKIQDKPENLLRGQIDYVLFSHRRAKTFKARTNSLLSSKATGNASGTGAKPSSFLRVTQPAYKLGPLAHDT